MAADTENISVIYGTDIPKNRFSEQRDIFPELEDFMLNSPRGTDRICALYGLRRTGKTEMMMQCIDRMDEKDKKESAYVLIEKPTYIAYLKKCLSKLMKEGIRNIFIDEITAIEDFQAGCSTLSDYYSRMGCHIAIAGTNSLGIMLASHSSLYDRVDFINTTHVPYAEFSRLLGGKTMDDYIKYGGTLTDSQYKSMQSRDEYLNKYIVGNILHSLEDGAEGRSYWCTVVDLYGRDEVASVINKMINKFSYNVTLGAINKNYANGPSHAIIRGGSLPEYEDIVKLEEIDAGVKGELRIKDKGEMETTLTPVYLEGVKDYLRDLGLLTDIPEYSSLKYDIKAKGMEILNQPGMIYAHAEALIDQLMDDASWEPGTTKEQKDTFRERTDNYVKGEILERTALLETYQALTQVPNQRYYVTQISVDRDTKGVSYGGKPAEADLAVVDCRLMCTYLFEIKHSSEPLPDSQAKHLRNREFLGFVEGNFAPVRNIAVVYCGPSCEAPAEDGQVVQYLNAEEFMTDIHEMHLAIRDGELDIGTLEFGSLVGLDPELELEWLIPEGNQEWDN